MTIDHGTCSDLRGAAGWRALFRHALVFALPFVVALAALEVRLSMVVNSYTEKVQRFDAAEADVEAIVLGSSHEFEGVDTDAFDRPTFNLAMPSQSLAQSAELALRLLRERRPPRLRYVLLGVSYYSLPYRMASVDDPLLGFNMRVYRLFDDTRFADRINPFRYLYLGIYSWPTVQSMIWNRFDVRIAVPMTASGYDSQGVQAPPGAGPEFFEAVGSSRARYHLELGRAENIPRNLAVVQRLAEECRAAGVGLMLFTAPVTRYYATAFGESVWHERRRIVEEFARRFDLRYVDYSRSPEFTASDFGDGDHLNPEGARKFGRMLSKTLFW